MLRLMLFASHLFVFAAHASNTVICEDSPRSVSLKATFAKSTAVAPSKLTIESDNKTKDIDLKQISRFIRNDKDFYILFKVQTKVGLHELELNTRFKKSARAPRTSAGVLVNKTQNESLNVICKFS